MSKETLLFLKFTVSYFRFVRTFFCFWVQIIFWRLCKLVYNAEEAHLYVHHETFLPSLPLCMEWIDFNPTEPTPGIFVLLFNLMNS